MNTKWWQIIVRIMSKTELLNSQAQTYLLTTAIMGWLWLLITPSLNWSGLWWIFQLIRDVKQNHQLGGQSRTELLHSLFRWRQLSHQEEKLGNGRATETRVWGCPGPLASDTTKWLHSTVPPGLPAWPSWTSSDLPHGKLRPSKCDFVGEAREWVWEIIK